jgi:phenylalanyl-tRNA synthetase beta chain
MVGAVLSGTWNKPGWNVKDEQLDFYDGKGVIESVARELNIDRLRMAEPDEGGLSWLQPGKAAVVLLGNDPVGWLGEIHPLVAQKFEVDDAVVAFEFDVAKFIKASKAERDFVPPPRYPAREMDIALVIDEDVKNQDVERRIVSLGKKTPLKSAHLFDVYRGKGVPEGKKSMAYRLAYRADDKTLTSEEVEKVHEKVLAKLKQELGAELRG